MEIGPRHRVTRAWSSHVRRICSIIRTQYHEPISLRTLAACVGRNAAYTATLFHRQTGTTSIAT